MQLVHYDIVHNAIRPLMTYDCERLRDLEARGIYAYSIDDDGTRTYIPADEIKEPEDETIWIPFVRGELFLEVMEPIVDAIDALSNQRTSPIATMAATAKTVDTSAIRAKLKEAEQRFDALKNGNIGGEDA